MINTALFGKRMDEFRRSKGYTQQELAELCNVSPKTIQVITSGKRHPSMSLFINLCIHLDHPAECFLNEDRKDFSLSNEQLAELKAIPTDKLKQFLSFIRSLCDEIK